MAHSNSIKFPELIMFSFKPLIAVKNYFSLLVAAFIEAKVMEQKSRKTSGNW
jgi:hypothetical protein